MSLRNCALFLALFPVLSWAQPPLSTVTVGVSQSPAPAAQPDQAVLSVSVSAGFDRSLDDIVTLLASLGITAANLVDVQGGSASLGNSPQLTWTFQLAVPAGKTDQTFAALASLQQALAQSGIELAVSFSTQNPALALVQPPQSCDFIGLFASARSQARTLAGVAGLTAGSVVSVSTSVAQSVPQCSMTVTFGLVVLFAQPPPTVVTVTASPGYPQAPPRDQVQLNLTVISKTTAVLNDVTGALAAGGISGAILGRVAPTTDYNAPNNPPALQWDFTLGVPLTTLKDTLGKLLTLQKSLTMGNSGLSLSTLIRKYGDVL